MSASGQNTGSARNEVEVDQIGKLQSADVAKTGSKTDFAGLIEKIAETKDRDAFAALFAHFAPRLKGYLLRLGASDGQAEEVLQEALLTVWRKADLFDRKKAAASTWIFTIARNRRIDILRKRKFPEIDAEDPSLCPMRRARRMRKSLAPAKARRCVWRLKNCPKNNANWCVWHFTMAGRIQKLPKIPICLWARSNRVCGWPFRACAMNWKGVFNPQSPHLKG